MCQLELDRGGRIFIDRDGEVFSHILEFLRDGHLPRGPVRVTIVPHHARS